MLYARHTNTKEIRVCVGTWNVGGRIPSDGLSIEKWLDMEDPSDIYVLGFQEIVPLNAGNIFGAEDSKPAKRWESIIRKTLNKFQPGTKSPVNFNSFDDHLGIDEICSENGSQGCSQHAETDPLVGNVAHPSRTYNHYSNHKVTDLSTCSSQLREDHVIPNKKLQSEHFNSMKSSEKTASEKFISRTSFRHSESSRSSHPEHPLISVGCENSGCSNSYNSVNPFGVLEPLKSSIDENKLRSNLHKRENSKYVRIMSKQMIGIFLSIWVRKGLRKYIRNVNVSSVGVGIMGCIGNKGSVSVSMSIHQTPICFICSHLASGANISDHIRRNADVQEILQRTHFHIPPGSSLPKTILDHEVILWHGDLNYRINLSYDEVCDLISQYNWSKLSEMDQLKHELKKGQVFEGWMEGDLRFPPTYKYEFGSGKYVGEDHKTRRTPAWCDRILSFGTGIQFLRYKRSELSLSDHRPVTGIYSVTVGVHSHRRFQRDPSVKKAVFQDYLLSHMDDAWQGTT